MKTHLFYNCMIICFLSVFIISCTSSETALTQDEIYKEYSSGVVLIRNSYYYSVRFQNGTEAFFSELDMN